MGLNDDYWSQVMTRTDKLGAEYCLIPKMQFYARESGALRTVPAPFFLGKYPVTRAEFLQFTKQANYDYAPVFQKMMDEESPDPDCPAAPLSWWDAKYYVRWLRHVTGEYYSLPTEVEWEAAAGGIDNRLYPWGNEAPTDLHALFSVDRVRSTTDQVGTHPLGLSPQGCAEMVGNVWEWCLDSFDDENEIHALRGGSCQQAADEITCATRAFASLGRERFGFAGFRVVYVPPAHLEQYCRANEVYLA